MFSALLQTEPVRQLGADSLTSQAKSKALSNQRAECDDKID
jgi:hypothetical protein